MKNVIVIFSFLFFSTSLQAKSDPVKVLIIDGYSNHDWRYTTEVIQTMLVNSGFCEVDISTAPTNNSPDYNSWNPDFSKYDVVVQNVNSLGNGNSWPKPVQTKFENYMKKDFIVENILYHNTLIKMKSINPANIKKRIRMVKNIYEQYIDTNGSLALNLEGSQLSHIKQLLEEQEMSTPTLEQIEQYYENEIMTQVKHNIKDVFMRFTKTKEGSKIMKQKDKDKEWDKV